MVSPPREELSEREKKGETGVQNRIRSNVGKASDLLPVDLECTIGVVESSR